MGLHAQIRRAATRVVALQVTVAQIARLTSTNALAAHVQTAVRVPTGPIAIRVLAHLAIVGRTARQTSTNALAAHVLTAVRVSTGLIAIRVLAHLAIQGLPALVVLLDTTRVGIAAQSAALDALQESTCQTLAMP